MINPARICGRSREEGGLKKTDEVTSALRSLPEKGGTDENQRRNWVARAPLIQKRTCFPAEDIAISRGLQVK